MGAARSGATILATRPLMRCFASTPKRQDEGGTPVHPVMVVGCACVLSLLALSACDEADDQAGLPLSPAQSALIRDARVATEAELRRVINAPIEFSDMRSFRQAAAESVAICGQVSLLGSGRPAAFIAIVSRQADGSVAVEPHVAVDSVSATRVFVDSHARCVVQADGGQRRAAPPRLPVIPTNLPTLRTNPSQEAGRLDAARKAAQQVDLGHATLRQPGNKRAHPNGGGEVVRVLPRGSTLRIFAEAPGGWYQLGGERPEGWVHASMLSRSPAGPSPSVATAAR